MFLPKFLLEKISEDEALVILASLGFTCIDWFFIKKIGGAKFFLETDLCEKIFLMKSANNPFIKKFLENFLHSMEAFYSNGGVLISKNNFQHHPLFKAKQAPMVFFGRNYTPKQNRVHVSIVGSRSASTSALNITCRLSRILSERGVTIVSGGALGVDYKAHEGAINEQGSSLAILGAKVELLSDERPERLFSLNENFPSVTPFGPWDVQGKYMFVERNVFVAGIADALVFVQGKENSGTLHTANFAKKLNIPLYCIPGDLDNPLSFVPNMLIAKREAEPIFDFYEFADKMLKRKKSEFVQKEIPKKQYVKAAVLPEILEIIKNNQGSLSLSEIIMLTNKPLQEVQDLLLDYELEGKVIKQGAQFVLTDK